MMESEDLSHFRKILHKTPELSEHEKHTSSRIVSKLKLFRPTQIFENVGGYGVLAVFDFHRPGPCVVFRAELDALPIQEKNHHDHQSSHVGVSHTCGHDGHMSILLGLAQYLSTKKEHFTGKVVLLFQPAEETAVGAHKVMQDQRFHDLKPTHVFGVHNIPLYPLGSVLVKHDIFASASQGLILRFHGTSSHAGHPDQGLNPWSRMMRCIKILQDISDLYQEEHADTFITIIHVKLGERAFGTSPGEGVIMTTFRSYNQNRMDEMTTKTIQQLTIEMKSFEGKWEYEWVEVFPAIKNNSECVDIISSAANTLGLPIFDLKKPFCWSEDFSYYLHQYPGAFFGLGSGVHQPVLHHPSYDFPDDLLEHGVQLLKQIVIEIQKG